MNMINLKLRENIVCMENSTLGEKLRMYRMNFFKYHELINRERFSEVRSVGWREYIKICILTFRQNLASSSETVHSNYKE